MSTYNGIFSMLLFMLRGKFNLGISLVMNKGYIHFINIFYKVFNHVSGIIASILLLLKRAI